MTFTKQDIIRELEKAKSVPIFTKKLLQIYNNKREYPSSLRLSFDDTDFKSTANYLFKRAQEDTEMNAALQKIVLGDENVPVKPRSPPKIPPTIQRPGPTRSVNHLVPEFSGVHRLLFGITDPSSEKYLDVSLFLRNIADAREPDWEIILRTLQGDKMKDDNFIRKFALKYITPSAATLQDRVDRTVKEQPAMKIPISRALAGQIRESQETTQQLIRTNKQLEDALLLAMKDMTLSPQETGDLKKAIKQLSAVRKSSLREINSALKIASSALIDSGSPGPSTVALSLLRKAPGEQVSNVSKVKQK